MRLRVLRFGFSCDEAPHFIRTDFWLTLCLGRVQLMWRRRS